MKKGKLRVIALVWGALMIAVISSTATLLVSGRMGQGDGETRRWVTQAEYDTIQRYSRLDEVRQSLMKDYYKTLDEDDLVLGAIRGMTGATGDPYTFYYTPEELKRENEDSAGVYFGIGTLLQNTADGEIVIVRVFPDSPAERAGVHTGDVILAVDGVAVTGADGRSYLEAVRRIRGWDRTQVTLTVRRDGERMAIPVTRGDVKISYASYQVLPGNIGYINIAQFTGDASQVFHEAIDAFKGSEGCGHGDRRAQQSRGTSGPGGQHRGCHTAQGPDRLHPTEEWIEAGFLFRRGFLRRAPGGAGQRHVRQRLGDTGRLGAGPRQGQGGWPDDLRQGNRAVASNLPV